MEKVKPIIKRNFVTSHYICPICRFESLSNLGYGKTGYENIFCPKCGQEFDWESVKDEEIILNNKFINR